MDNDGTIKTKLVASLATEIEVTFVPDDGSAYVNIQTLNRCDMSGGFSVDLAELSRAVEWIETGAWHDNIAFGDSGGTLSRSTAGRLFLELNSGTSIQDYIVIDNAAEFASILRSVIAACMEGDSAE
mgnify:CR=1 FL=1